MRQGEKQRTSVFSEYQNNENDSISSRQLEFWLKQTAPVAQQRPANQWTLMSTNSIYEEDEHPLIRNETFETINKENDLNFYNSARANQNTSAVLKSKSYLNAMTDLQSKVKQLEQQNNSLKNSLRVIKEDRNRSMSQSSYMAEQLKNRITLLEPKAKKLEEMVRENKMLRDWREQNMKKLKTMEKLIREYGQKLLLSEKEVSRLKEGQRVNYKVGEQSEYKFKQFEKVIEKLKSQNTRLSQKNKVLEDMKERSTTAVLEKYSKSVNEIQLLTLDNDNLKRELANVKAKGEEKQREISQQHRKQRQQLFSNSQRLKQENIEKKEMIITLKNEVNYFKENYEKSKEELISNIKIHSKEIQQIKEREMQLQIQYQIEQQKPKEIVYIETHKEQPRINRQSIIHSNANEVNHKNQVQSQLQFEQINSMEPDELEEIPFYETRSAIDKESEKNIFSKSQIHRQNDTLSQENYRENVLIQDTKSKEKKTMNLALKKSKRKVQQVKEKVKERSQEKIKSKEKSRDKSREKSRDIDKNNQGLSHEHSFILKSHEPLTHKEEPEYLYYTQEPGMNSTNNRKNVPYYWDSNEVADFGISQRGHPNHCSYNPITSEFRLQQALLNEINREAVRLIEEQERLVLNSSDENLTPNERSEYNGRMKQLNEQIRVNHEKRLEIKQRMNEG